MEKFGSDLVVDLIAAHGFPFAAINPGASWRGLHDSLVNYATPPPELIVCTNEKIAVNVAHGYAKVTGKPGLAIVHDVVGLMQATMGVYTAYVDQAPVLILGGTGPMAVGQRRPHIEWVHTAFPQSDLVRNYVKWDDQAFDAAGAVDGFARGYQRAVTEPQGPVYLCYDLGYQEAPLEGEPPVVVHEPSARDFPIDAQVAAEVATALLAAERPVIIAGRTGRRPETAAALQTLAELVGAPVYDLNWRFNLPNTHPLHRMQRTAVEAADMVLALDVSDLYGSLTAAGEGRGERTWLPAADARIAEIRLDVLEGNGWLPKFQKYQRTDWSVLADTRLALPALAACVRDGRTQAQQERAEARLARAAAWQTAQRARYREQARATFDDVPISTARLAWELGEAIDGEDWVLTANSLSGWTHRLWDFDDWTRHPGRSLGTASQIGISMGVARAYRDTGKLVVDIQPDGDLLFDPGTLWTIAASRLPMLVVMYNNRAYYNDWDHQIQVARDRGRNPERANIGMDLADPAPDYAAMARSCGWEAYGPVEDPTALRPALERAVSFLKREGRPVLVDVVTAHR